VGSSFCRVIWHLWSGHLQLRSACESGPEGIHPRKHWPDSKSNQIKLSKTKTNNSSNFSFSIQKSTNKEEMFSWKWYLREQFDLYTILLLSDRLVHSNKMVVDLHKENQ
jgi:hypothetical protein